MRTSTRSEPESWPRRQKSGTSTGSEPEIGLDLDIRGLENMKICKKEKSFGFGGLENMKNRRDKH